eukprot:56312_1
MSMQIISTTLVVISWLGIISTTFAVYGTCWLNGQYLVKVHKTDISMLGLAQMSPHHLVFTIGFVIASQFMLCAAILKCWLMKTTWRYPTHITMLFFIACICLSIMACIPPSIEHFVPAITSIMILILVQILDANHWRNYCIYINDAIDFTNHCLIIYSFVCPI